MKKASIASIHDFQPRQIVCLEHENSCLYAEVVQVVTSRQVCWVRPLMLAVLPKEDANAGTGKMSVPQYPVLYDLRQGADLVWPIALFRFALDTEVIPLLVQLDTASTLVAHQELSRFVRQVWQACKSEF